MVPGSERRASIGKPSGFISPRLVVVEVVGVPDMRRRMRAVETQNYVPYFTTSSLQEGHCN
jgi:hypothetical protein